MDEMNTNEISNETTDLNEEAKEINAEVIDSPYLNPEDAEKNIKKKAPKSFASSVFDIIEMVAACAAVILLLFTFISRLTIVDGPSMNNTLKNGDYVIVNSLGYIPTKGDIVVLQDPTANGYTKPLIKRLIATAGDTVDIDFSTWTVTVNGEVLDESEYLYLAEDAVFTSDYHFPITVEEGKVFVMGDNRHHSADSRLSAIGQIDERCIVGHAVMRVLPFSNFTIFDN